MKRDLIKIRCVMATATPIDCPSPTEPARAEAFPPVVAGAQTMAELQTSKAMRPVLLFALTMALLIVGLWAVTQNQAVPPGSDELSLPVAKEIAPPDEPVVSAKVAVIKEVPVALPQATAKDAKTQGSSTQASAAGKIAKSGPQSSVNTVSVTNPTPTGPSSPELNKLVIDAINK